MKIPTPIWFYILPMAASNLGWIPAHSSAYLWISHQLLPICMVLLLIGIDARALLRLGPTAICLIFASALGTVLGAVVSFLIYRPWLPAQAWGAMGALTASWIGGSVNLLAVQQALAVPETLIGPILLVDVVVSYSWMALLIASIGLQPKWDRLLGKNRLLGDAPPSPHAQPGSLESQRDEHRPPSQSCPIHSLSTSLPSALILLTLAILISFIAQNAAHIFPKIGSTFTPSTLTVLMTTTAAILLSLSPLSRLSTPTTDRLGRLSLYLVIASIGAQASWKGWFDAPIFLAVGCTWILTHGLVLLIVGWLLKAPWGLLATASQAAIGGPVSAPIVGATFSPTLAAGGLLMALAGNLMGTYIGLLTAWWLRIF
jgi:uncharacterized membrane protein